MTTLGARPGRSRRPSCRCLWQVAVTALAVAVQCGVSFASQVAGHKIQDETQLKALNDVHHEAPHHGSTLLRIFLHPVPDKFCADVYDSWPVSKAKEYEYMRTESHPFGEQISPGDDTLRNTNQFSVERWFQVQLQSGSPLVVSSFDEADVVYVCSAVFNSYAWMDAEGNALMNEFMHEFPNFLPQLHEKPHVLVLPHVARNYWIALGPVSKWLANFTVAIIEPYTVWDHTFSISRDQQFKIPITPENCPTFNTHMVTIPYAAHVHFAGPIHVTTNNGHAQPASTFTDNHALHAGDTFDVAGAEALKDLFSSFSISWRNYFSWREKLKNDCVVVADELCKHHTFHINNDTNFLESMDITRRSRYCYQPGGDTPLRQAFYDCLLTGTIPVVMHWEVYNVLPFGDLLNYTTMVQPIVSENMGWNKISMIDELLALHSKEGARAKLEAIAYNRHLLQYSLAPMHTEVRLNRRWVASPQDDAWTMAWKAIMRKLCDTDQRLPTGRCAVHHTESLL